MLYRIIKKIKKFLFPVSILLLLMLSGLGYFLLNNPITDIEKFPTDDQDGMYEIRCDSRYWLMYRPSDNVTLSSYYGDSRYIGISIVESEKKLEEFCGEKIRLVARFAAFHREPLCRTEDQSNFCETGKVPGVIIKDIQKL